MKNKPVMLAHIATDIIFKRNNNILLLKRSATNKVPGQYSFISDKCDEGESIIDCAIREAYEEIGIHVQVENLQFAHVVHKIIRSNIPSKDWIFFFIVEDWQGEPFNKEPEKYSEMTWFSSSELPLSFGETHRQAIMQWQNKQHLSLLYEQIRAFSNTLKLYKFENSQAGAPCLTHLEPKALYLK